MIEPRQLDLSGERIVASYRFAADGTEARAMAETLCFEQTVELPPAHVPAGDIREQIVGRVESLEPSGPDHSEARISFAVEAAGAELTQLLNLLFGNSSIKPGIRLTACALPDSLLATYRGPRFGVSGLRERLGVPARPLLCTALKPMGLSPAQLGELAYAFAKGGIDLIKDDHGLADQSFCPFEARVEAATAAVARANAETGGRCAYLANVTSRADQLVARARFAAAAGAGGLLIAPGLVGVEAMRQVADDDRIALPILSHPALQGGFVVSPDCGVSHGIIFGLFNRLAGGDAVIFPNHGGRFAFTAEDCASLATACAAPLGELRPIFPVPAGGMSLARVPEMARFYGPDVIFLIGGDLHGHGPDLVATCQRFRALLDEQA